MSKEKEIWYCHVKICDGNIEQIDIVRSDKIQNFDVSKKSSKKFNVKWSNGNVYQGVVGAYAKTEDELKELLKKRHKFPPTFNCDSASELENKKPKKDVPEESSLKMPQFLQNQLDQLTEKKTQIFLSKVKHLQEEKSNAAEKAEDFPENKLNSSAEVSKAKETFDEINNKESSEIDQENSAIFSMSNSEKVSFKNYAQLSSWMDIDDTNSNEPKTMKTSTPESVQKSDKIKTPLLEKQQENKSDRDIYEYNGDSEEDFEEPPAKKRRSRNEFRKTDSMNHKKNNLENTYLKTIVNNEEEQKELICKLKKENQILRQQLSREKQKNEDNQLLLAEAQRANMTLQTDVIGVMQELKGEVVKLKQADVRTADPNGYYRPVGYQKPITKERHVGRNFYLSNEDFESIVGENTPGSSVRELSRRIFGIKTLKESTTTGASRSKDENGKIIPKKKLDPLKMNALSDFGDYVLSLNKDNHWDDTKKKRFVGKISDLVGQLCVDVQDSNSKSTKKQKSNNSAEKTKASEQQTQSVEKENEQELQHTFEPTENFNNIYGSNENFYNEDDLDISGELEDASPYNSDNGE